MGLPVRVIAGLTPEIQMFFNSEIEGLVKPAVRPRGPAIPARCG
jgi:hypothetical protein